MKPHFHESLLTLPVIASSDHPLSLGATVRLCTQHDMAFAESEATNEQVQVFSDDSYSGYCAYWPEHNLYVIFIATTEGETPISPIRLIELVVHECSHLVDAFFEGICVTNVETEFRAYQLDWLVGKTLHHFCIGADRSCGRYLSRGR